MLNTLTQLNIFTVPLLDKITKLIYYTGTIIAIEFYIFCKSLFEENKKNNLYFIFFIAISTLPFFLFTDRIIGKYYVLENQYYWEHGKFILLFIIEFYYFVISGFIFLFKYLFKHKNDKFKRKNIINLIILFLSGFIPPSILSIIFPLIGLYKFDWLSVIFIPIWLIFIWLIFLRKNIFEINIDIIEVGIFLFLFSYFSLILIIKTVNELLIYTTSIIGYLIFSFYLLKMTREKQRNENLIKKLSDRIH
jgi:hypothetical protein